MLQRFTRTAYLECNLNLQSIGERVSIRFLCERSGVFDVLQIRTNDHRWRYADAVIHLKSLLPRRERNAGRTLERDQTRIDGGADVADVKIIAIAAGKRALQNEPGIEVILADGRLGIGIRALREHP